MKTIYKSNGDMADTPAAVDRERRILYINPKLYFKLTPFQQKFVKLHEYGHLNMNTSNEFVADAYAFDRLAGTEFRSLKQCIECLNTILDPSNPGHKVRIDALYERALEWDRQHPVLEHAAQSTNAEDIEAMTQMIMAAGQAATNADQIRANENVQQVNTKYLALAGIAVIAILLIPNQ